MGAAVAVQFDGVPSTKSVEGRLLGRPRLVPTGIFDILRVSRCAVVPMLAIGNSRNFEIRFSAALPLVEAETRDGFVRANLPLVLGAIEKQIVDHPEEWMLWTHL
jgi:lauroyl/myristoyl acyltransferase